MKTLQWLLGELRINQQTSEHLIRGWQELVASAVPRPVRLELHRPLHLEHPFLPHCYTLALGLLHFSSYCGSLSNVTCLFILIVPLPAHM